MKPKHQLIDSLFVLRWLRIWRLQPRKDQAPSGHCYLSPTCLTVLIIILNFSFCHFEVRAELRNGMSADIVLGQLDFTSNAANRGGNTAANTISESRGVAIYQGKLFVCDHDNRRVLIWNDITKLSNGAAADIVVGQVDFTSTVAATSQTNFQRPMGVSAYSGKLFISDISGDRVLIWNQIPTSNGVPADVVVGQVNFTNDARNVTPTGLGEPNGVFSDGKRLFIADNRNNRVLIYDSIPTQNGAAADIVIGQPSFTTDIAETSRTGLFRPLDIEVIHNKMIVTDRLNRRALIWNEIPTQNQVPADLVLGQSNFDNVAADLGAPSQDTLDSPERIATDGEKLIISDNNNHRIMIWNSIPTTNSAPADFVIGQANFNDRTRAATGVNMDDPVGVAFDGRYLAVGDRDNNRVLIYNLANSGLDDLGPQFSEGKAVVGKVFWDINGTLYKIKPAAAGKNKELSVSSTTRKTTGSKMDLLIRHAGTIFALFLLLMLNFSLFTFEVRAELRNGMSADIVLGQPDFESNTLNNGGVSESSLRGANGVATDGTRLAIADTANHRILIWNQFPTANRAPADVVVGQPDFTSAVLNNGGRSARSLNGPRDVFIYNGQLLIADSSNERVLIFNTIPTGNFASADLVIGQSDFTSGVSATTQSGLDNPAGVMRTDDALIVADERNDRVLVWQPFPTSNGEPADIVLGQPTFLTNNPILSRNGFANMNNAYFDGKHLIVPDSSSSRTLIFNSLPQENFTPADIVLGQTDFFSANQRPLNQGMGNVDSVFSNGEQLFVTDATNHRILVWNQIPTVNDEPADLVIGQENLFENDARAGAKGLNSPRGIIAAGRRLVVADRDNNRVLIYNLGESNTVDLGPQFSQGKAVVGKVFWDVDGDGVQDSV